MRYLVTGAFGFIGSHLCDALIQRGDEVVCVDNLVTGSLNNIWHLRKHPQFKFCITDVDYHHFENFDGIFHLASPAAPVDINANSDMTFLVNSEGTKHLISHAKSGGSKFLFVSTMKVHGDCERVDSYIKGKRAGEQLCLDAGAKVARLASVYGPRMAVNDSRVIPVFITRALREEPLSLWNGGSQIDSFCYVSDIVRVLLAFMDSDHSGVIEFGNPEGISIAQLALEILELTGIDCTLNLNEKVTVVEQCHNLPNLSLAKEYFGWEPEITIKEGLERTIDYFRNIMKEKPCLSETMTTSVLQ